jgi:hypothetical protein
MRRDGVIIRRGLGQPEWRDAVNELVGERGAAEEYDDSYAPLFKKVDQTGGKKS